MFSSSFELTAGSTYCTALVQVHRALVILEPVETDVDSLKALLTVDKGAISKSRGGCTAKPLAEAL